MVTQKAGMAPRRQNKTKAEVSERGNDAKNEEREKNRQVQDVPPEPTHRSVLS